MAPVSSVSFEILTLSKFCSILVFPSTRLALRLMLWSVSTSKPKTQISPVRVPSVKDPSWKVGFPMENSCVIIFSPRWPLCSNMEAWMPPRRQVASFMLFSPSMLIRTFTVLVSSVGVNCSEHSMLSVTSNPSMTQVASFSGEVVLTSLAERFSICLAYASKVWKAFSPRKAMPPKSLNERLNKITL